MNKKISFKSLIISIITLLIFSTPSIAQRKGFMLESFSKNIEKTKLDIHEIADLGGDIVRFPIYYNANNDVNYWLGFADQVYKVANQRRVNLVIDFHNPSPQTGSQIIDENDFVLKWSAFSQHFGGKTDRQISIWYDLANEPSHPEWERIALRAAQEIRRYDTISRIVYSPRGTTTRPASNPNFKPLPGISKQIVQFHFWNWQQTLQSPDFAISNSYKYGGVNANFTLSQMQGLLEEVSRFGRRYRVPVYIGEVGINRDHPNTPRFLRDFTNECSKKNIHLTIHAYQEASVWDYQQNERAWNVLTNWLAQ